MRDGNEAGRLEPMMTKAGEDRGAGRSTGLAGSGRFGGKPLKIREDRGLDACVPMPRHPPRRDRGDVMRFGGDDDFRCDARNDTHACPAGQWLTRRGSPRTREGKRHFGYGSVAAVCRDCSPRDRCLTKSRPRRRLDRWEPEDAIGRHRGKMSAGAPWMRQRSALLGHPFGTVKRWAGMDRFPMRGHEKRRGAFSPMTLGYNFKRVMNELGAAAFREHCLQKRQTGMIGAQHCSGSRVFPSFSAASGWRCGVGSCEGPQVPNVRLLGGDRSGPDTDTAVRNNGKSSAKADAFTVSSAPTPGGWCTIWRERPPASRPAPSDRFLHGEEEQVRGDAGYRGIGKRAEHAHREVSWQIAMNPADGGQGAGAGGASVPDRERVFGHDKVRYRGLKRNLQWLALLLGFSNLMIAQPHLS